MTDSIEILHKLVGQLKAYYNRYLEASEAQRRALVQNDLEEISTVNKEIDTLSNNLQELENRRRYVLDKISTEMGVEILNIRDVATHCQYVEMDALQQETSELKNLLKEVFRSNQINQKLIKSSREFIRSNMAIVTGYGTDKRQQKYRTYGNTGSYNQVKKQARMLVNKEV